MARTLIENIVEIDKTPAVVFDYASDHTHEPEWNPKMKRVRKLTDGPIGEGTKYAMEFVPGQPMVVTCVGFDRPSRWEAVGDTYRSVVRPTAGGARLVLRTEFEAKGPMALALPLVGSRMRRELQRDVETMKAHPGVGSSPGRRFSSS